MEGMSSVELSEVAPNEATSTKAVHKLACNSLNVATTIATTIATSNTFSQTFCAFSQTFCSAPCLHAHSQLRPCPLFSLAHSSPPRFGGAAAPAGPAADLAMAQGGTPAAAAPAPAATVDGDDDDLYD